MDQRSREIIERLCASLTQGTPGPQQLASAQHTVTRKEAFSIFSEVFRGVDLPEKISRIKAERRPPQLVRHLRYGLHCSILGHDSEVSRFCFDNSSVYAFSAGQDGLIKIWNIREGMLVRSLRGHIALINDMSVSSTGEYLISADTAGLVNVWSLRDFTVAHRLEMGMGVIFCEFFRPLEEDGLAASFVTVLANGIVKIVRIAENGTIATCENTFMEGETIKTICISEGGRFMICGGPWQFTLVYDTQDLSRVMVLEDAQAHALCTSRNGLKIAAAFETHVAVYTFYAEGSSSDGNYKRRMSQQGHWTRHLCVMENDDSVQSMCFLDSQLLLVLTFSGQLCAYEDGQLVFKVPCAGSFLSPHPFKNIIACLGEEIAFYELVADESAVTPVFARRAAAGASDFPDTAHACCALNDGHVLAVADQSAGTGVCIGKSCLRAPAPVETLLGARSNRTLVFKKIFEAPVAISWVDCQFSMDGRFFILSHINGAINAYSVHGPVDAPSEQFFTGDFRIPGVTEEMNGRITEDMRNQAMRSGPVGGDALEEMSFTVDSNTNINANWRKGTYRIQCASPCLALGLEALAAEYLAKDRLNYMRFSKLYLVKEEETEPSSEEDKTLSSCNESSSSSGESSACNSSSEYAEVIASESEGDVVSVVTFQRQGLAGQERRGRRLVLSSEGSLEERETESQRRSSLETPVLGRTSRRRAAENARRRILSDGSTQDEQPAATHRPSRRRAAINARRIVSSEEDGSGSGVEERRRLRRRRHTAQTSETASEGRPRRGSRRAAADARQRGADAESPSPPRLRRHRRLLVDSNEGVDMYIEPGLEKTLSAYAQAWLSSFSVYKNDIVRFDANAYRAFIELEGRLGESAIPRSGVYRVSEVDIRHIGSIPYLRLVINRYTIAYYEYPDGTGILCHECQWDAANTIRLIGRGRLLSTSILDAGGLQVKTARGWVLRSSIFIEGVDLQVPPIPTNSDHKVLFGILQPGDNRFYLVLNYSIVNRRLETRQYREMAHLRQDLEKIFRNAPRQHRGFAKGILESIG